ncbi:MAG: hypothetical protein ABIP30_03725 [Ferruginibacter sp.]
MDTIIHLLEGEEEISALLTDIPNRNHGMYKVTFESGYENLFFTDVETGKWIEEDLGFTQLAEQIGEEVRKFCPSLFHVPKILTWHKEYTNKKLMLFGFFNFAKGSTKMYEIYNGNKKYMYTLLETENDEWQILGSNTEGLENIDNYFLRNVIQILPYYTSV